MTMRKPWHMLNGPVSVRARAIPLAWLVALPCFANEALIHAFSAQNNGTNPDGANPAAGLALANNVLWGTTANGGAHGAGTIFYVTIDGATFSAFRTFTNAPDAGNPQGELAISGNQLFGTTLGGGGHSTGTLFAGQTNGAVSIVWSFATVSADTATNAGGASPTGLTALSSTTIYGTTTAGGVAANGTVFAAATNGATFSVLHDFSLLDSQAGTNGDGAAPWGGLVLSGSKLFGTASAGGAGGCGVVFSIGTNGANFNVLHHFALLDPLTATNADGAIPFGGLLLSSNTLYGTTCAGGQNGHGVVFSLETNGLNFTVLHHFTATDPATGTNADGASPCAALILASNLLWGTASGGGAGASGTIFSLDTASGQFAVLHAFAAPGGGGTNADGAFPVTPVLRQGNSLYGTAFSGGPQGAGTIFVVPIPPPAATITNILFNGNGSVTLSFVSAANSTNFVQFATNLTEPVAWQNVSTNVADANGGWQFTDTNTITTAKFYRSYAP